MTTESEENKREEDHHEELDYDHDMSLWLFHKDNKFRMCMTSIAKSPIFENFIILLIVISSIQLTLENPLNDPNGRQAMVLQKLDLVVTSIFCLEVFIKVIA